MGKLKLLTLLGLKSIYEGCELISGRRKKGKHIQKLTIEEGELGLGNTCLDPNVERVFSCDMYDFKRDVNRLDPRIASRNVFLGFHYTMGSLIKLQIILRGLPVNSLSEYCFIDLGGGKGGPAIEASLLGCGKAVSVEYSEPLCGIARKNLRVLEEKYRKGMGIDVICKDASLYRFPKCPLIIYMYNPFKGPVMQRVAQNIQDQVTPGSFVIYSNPLYADILEKATNLKRMYKEINKSYRLYSVEK